MGARGRGGGGGRGRGGGAVWVAGTQVAGAELVVRSGTGENEVGLASVVVTALVVALVAAALLRVLERRARRGVATWTASAAAVLLLSVVGPLSAVSLSAGLWLAALHLAVASVVVGGLRSRHAGRVA